MKTKSIIAALALLLVSSEALAQTVNLSSPPPPAVSVVTAIPSAPLGNHSHCYWVVAIYPIGQVFSNSPGCTSSANLQGGGTVIVNWGAVPGATGYIVLRTSGVGSSTFPASGTCTNCLVANNVSGGPVTDSAGALSSFTISSTSSAAASLSIDNKNYPTPRIFSTLPFMSAPNTGVLFAQLGTETNGGFIYCFDCQQTNPCAGGGTGAFAQGVAGAWNCGGGGGSGANPLASYLVAGATNAPTNAVNLGALATGLLKISVSGGVATASIGAVADITTLFGSCTGTQYLGFDGNCHTAGGVASVTGVTPIVCVGTASVSCNAPTAVTSPAGLGNTFLMEGIGGQASQTTNIQTDVGGNSLSAPGALTSGIASGLAGALQQGAGTDATGILASGSYVSGGTVTGSSTQTCTVSGFNNQASTGSAPAVTIALTGSNSLSGGTLTITSGGTLFTGSPTSATLANGTATCSGTITITSTLGLPVGTVTQVEPASIATSWKETGANAAPASANTVKLYGAASGTPPNSTWVFFPLFTGSFISGDALCATGTTGEYNDCGAFFLNGAAVPASATAVGTNSSHQIVAATVQGNGSKVQLSTGSTTTNDCVKFDANGNTVDAGAACGTGGSSTVTTRLVSTGTTDTILTGDQGKLVNYNVSLPMTVTLPQCTSSGFAAGWYFHIGNIGLAPVILVPTTSQVDGRANIVLQKFQGVAEIVCDAGGNYFTDQFNYDASDTRVVYFRDDFNCGGTAVTSLGCLTWSESHTNTATYGGQISTWPNLGVLQAVTSSTASSSSSLALGPSVSTSLGALGSNAPWQVKFIIKLGQTTNNRIRLGICGSNSITCGNENMAIRLDQNASAPGGTDTNWTYESRHGSTSTIFATSIAPDTTNFHTLEISSDTVGTITFKIDGANKRTFCASGCDTTATITTNQLAAYIITGNDVTASSSALNIDFFSFKAFVSTASTGERQ